MHGDMDHSIDAANRPPPFAKVLWRKQPYPDNYNDESFLEHLKQNCGSAMLAERL